MQPIKRLEQWLLTSHINSSGRLYSTAAFRSLFPELTQGAYRALIHRAEKRGLLERVCQGIYQYVGAPDTSGLILFHAAALLRARHFNYISLETVLSEGGLLSQIPMAWITVVSTGRSAEISCGRFGTIEFVHTERTMSLVIDELSYDPRCHLYRASQSLALADMRRFNRSTMNLVQEPPNGSI
ncbi:type IV toxin-antitoxin system AbiEi family antitoxin [Salinispirillum marinum]|uniref:Type IV toxin-antitoxin system AbiEi family antitoxin n=2 Tax=Saccharospirillaceae TaxID=255527 RepID=A0ABV8BDD3_9GAMM